MGNEIKTAYSKEVSNLNLPVQDYRKTHIKIPKDIYQGLDSIAYAISEKFRYKKILRKNLINEAHLILDKAHLLSKKSDRRLKDSLILYAQTYRRYGKCSFDVLSDSIAVMVEAMERTIGLRPYPVQIMGAIVLHKGYLAEMATGEGKTLTACIPATLAAWTGRPCHIITVNDYLASRDAVAMQSFYKYCGVSAGCVTGEMDDEKKRINYNNGVVYATSKEILADFLRDRLKLGQYKNASRRLIRSFINPDLNIEKQLTLNGLDTAIVDEADSVLIDEAVTPLIISAPQENKDLVNAVKVANLFASEFEIDTDYKVDLKYQEINFTKKGYLKIDDAPNIFSGIWKGESRRAELVKQALTAKEFYHLDKQYVIQDGKVVIVDEFTGRLMPSRSWSYGLHQAIEEKEGLEMTNPSQTFARLSFQRFFRLFKKLSGMTGTAQEAKNEFWQIYGLSVVSIETNKPCIRKVYPDAVFSNSDKKWNSVLKKIINRHKTGQPILVGTRSVQASEKLASMLEQEGLAFNLLNAVKSKEEARIIAEAGEMGKITIATNMAGRGTDIKLGRGVAERGGLHVITTERHKSGRIDRQLFGRCARQGDTGSCQAFISIEDELPRNIVSKIIRRRLSAAIEKDIPLSKYISKSLILFSQKIFERRAFLQRRNVLRMDTWLEDSLSFTGSDVIF
jgi:preprotein translocase subunit SecA